MAKGFYHTTYYKVYQVNLDSHETILMKSFDYGKPAMDYKERLESINDDENISYEIKIERVNN